MPMRVMPTCTELRKASGLASSFRMVLARVLPCSAKVCMRLGFTDTRAISLSEKKPLSKVSRVMIRNSMLHVDVIVAQHLVERGLSVGAFLAFTDDQCA